MDERTALLTFRITEPHEVALRSVRAALARQGLYVSAELDVAARIRQKLGAGLAPCVVLYVDDPAVLLEAIVFRRDAALLIPQPLVVTGNTRRTEVLIRTPESFAGEIPESVRDPLFDLLRRITQAMESIAGSQGEHKTPVSLRMALARK